MKFALKEELKRHHHYKHTFQKPFHCISCNLKYVEKCNLKRHQHKIEKHLECFLCNKPFIAKYERKLHLQTHTVVKLYQCENV